MLTPQRAIVRPRVFASEGSVALPIEEIVAELLDRGLDHPIQILGGPGSGKTTALRHLAATLIPLPHLVMLDDSEKLNFKEQANLGRVIFTSRKSLDWTCTILRLAPWTDDDLIEYLLATCPSHCASVIRRLHDSSDKPLMQGNPAVWRLTLDALAADDDLLDIRAAIGRWLPAMFRSGEERRLAGLWSLAIQVRDETSALRFLGQLAKRDEDFELIRPLRHQWIQRLLAAQHIADCLANPQPCGPLAQILPEPLVQEVARHVAPESTAARRLFHVVEAEGARYHSMAASILHASGANWRPTAPAVYRLSQGYFAGAAWQGAQIGHAPDRHSDLTDADLTEANLSSIKADYVSLNGARMGRVILRKASLHQVHAVRAELADADLTAADAQDINLEQANLQRAILDSAVLRGAILRKANLTEARFRDAVLAEASLRDSQIEGADFSGADMSRAILCGLALRTATLSGATFPGADLSHCDLEGVQLSAADFRNATLRKAWLTGSVMPAADFRDASLQGAGLADIHWEDADLRGADLRGCTFHMGSTRSGLVGSPYPGHGSKTGFYTDDYYDQGYKRPEEIRKADLRGADLRGAKLDGVDFYLVDLRDAKFDADAAEHLQRCGAILADRAAS